MNNKFLSAPFVLPALVIGLAILLSSFVGAATFLKARSLDDALSVTGSAKMRVTADSVKWSFNISRRVTEYTLQSGYSNMAKDLTAVKNFLSQNGLKEEQITIAPIYMEEMYKDPNSSGPREITLRQSIMVQSTDVAGITSLAKSTEILTTTGIFLSSFSPEYFYSKLAELRVSLLSDAIKDAKARANEIAKSSGQSVGSLKSASSGVVQVLAPNSVEVDSYGSYDTSSIEKDVMVTVRAVFFVK
ncbi:MAG: SIMPL domain-containing protein [Candidatus Paceibacterota bacterium]|jgi:hypothetical protein